MRRLERRDDPLGAREPLEGVERFRVRARQILRPSGVAQERVLRTDARIVESGRDRVGIGDLAVVVGEDGRARAVEDARTAAAKRGGAGGLDAHEPHVGVVDEPGEHPDRIRTAADARHDDLGESAFGFEQLLAGLPPDHRLKLPHDLRVRRRPDA